MAKIYIVAILAREYGHPDNRPLESHVLQEAAQEFDKICNAQAHSGEGGLAYFYLTSIKVE